MTASRSGENNKKEKTITVNIVTTTGRVRMVCGRNQLRGGGGNF